MYDIPPIRGVDWYDKFVIALNYSRHLSPRRKHLFISLFIMILLIFPIIALKNFLATEENACLFVLILLF